LDLRGFQAPSVAYGPCGVLGALKALLNHDLALDVDFLEFVEQPTSRQRTGRSVVRPGPRRVTPSRPRWLQNCGVSIDFATDPTLRDAVDITVNSLVTATVARE
jgi:hypothetical protein